MATLRSPRHGSMQFWPRVRAQKAVPRIRSWNYTQNYSGLLGFAGYKVGMTHVVYEEDRKNSPNKGVDVAVPVTVVECSPLKIYSVRLYTKTYVGYQLVKEFVVSKEKELSRATRVPKKVDLEAVKKELSGLNLGEYADIRVLMYTVPKELNLKKTPDLFETGIGGSMSDKLNFVLENLTKPIRIQDVFKEFDMTDVASVTKGKGFQGPIKRYGMKIRDSKSEKTKRGPGSLSAGWRHQVVSMYRVGHAGQMGYHTRNELNKLIVKISDKVDEINPKGGFLDYGFVNSDYVLIKGSVGGARKRLVRLLRPKRVSKNIHQFKIKYVSLDSKQ
ncbi:MAG: 50S ribosomal protein L3 [Candidatus Nanoarchaeia archaeon]|nr:50S ribosomal protein L3 [Candidatus Nanoarchaeia archaeon]